MFAEGAFAQSTSSATDSSDVPSNAEQLSDLPTAASLAQERVVLVGTAPVSGVYYPAGGAICRLLAEDVQRHGLRCLVESTNGSEENLRGVMEDRLDIGIVQSDWHYFAVNGLASFGGSGSNERLRSLFALHQEDIALVVGPVSGISKLSDLEGKRVNFGPEASGQRAITEIMLGTVNIAQADLASVESLDTSAQAAAFCSGTIDAFFLPVVTPSYAIAEIVNGCSGKVISLKGSEIDELIRSNPFFVKSVIPAVAYGGMTQDVETFGLRATVVTSEDLPNEVAYEIVSSVFDDFNKFRNQHLAFRNLDPSSLTKGGLSAPLHPAAKQYFQEKGLLE